MCSGRCASDVFLCVCLVRTCHIEMKVHMCSQALCDKAQLHSTIMHSESEPVLRLFPICVVKSLPMSCSM